MADSIRSYAQRFRKRPVEVEAMRYDGSNFEALAEWSAGAVDYRHITGVCVRTLEGPIWARPGDWIIRGVAGEFYPCKPDIFAATYELAETAVKGKRTQ
jgi:hypothetical protein